MNTEKKTTGDILFVNILLSISLTFISYLYILFEFESYAALREFLLQGQPFAINYVAGSTLLKYLPLLPIFMTWFFIGAIMYFIYYSLTNVYSFAYNQLLLSGYKKSEQKDDFKFQLRLVERLAVHFLATVGFASSIMVYLIFLLPFSETFYHYIETFLASSGLGPVYVTWLPLVGLFIYWALLVSVIQVGWHFIKQLEDYETFKEEHEAI